MLTNQIAISVGCAVEEEFEDGIPVVEFAESAGDDGGRKRLLGEGAGEPVDPVEDVLVDLGLPLFLLDEFVSLGNRASIATHVGPVVDCCCRGEGCKSRFLDWLLCSQLVWCSKELSLKRVLCQE